MKMIAIGILITSVATLTASHSEAQQKSPLTCNLTSNHLHHSLFGISITTPIECDFIENSVVVKDVILNRGNCMSMRKYIEGVFAHFRKDEEAFNKTKPATLDTYLADFNLKTFNFGDKAIFHHNCDNLLEATFQTNKGNWTFSRVNAQ